MRAMRAGPSVPRQLGGVEEELAMRVQKLVALLALTFVATIEASAQAIDGTVVLADRKSPAANARVWLMGSRNHIVDTARTNDRGRFHLSAPDAGRYSLVIRRIGYAPEHTDKLEFASGSVRTDTIITRSARVMKPIAVEVSRDTRRFYGMDVRQVGSRYINPEQVDKLRPGASDVSDLIRRVALPGVQVRLLPGGANCVETRALRGCAPVYLDGMPLGTELPWLSATDIDAMVVLRSLDGALVGYSGAVLLYTSR
jgi:hypothetical protein